MQRSPCLRKRNFLWCLSNIEVCNKIFSFYISFPAVRLLGSLGNRPEAVLLGSVAVCFLLLLVADYLRASMELGCFLAGLAIGSQGHSIVEQVLPQCIDVQEENLHTSLGFRIRVRKIETRFRRHCNLSTVMVFLYAAQPIVEISL